MSCENCHLTIGDYYSDNTYTWCTNCGNYGIAASVKRALVNQERPPHEVVLCFDIGCHGNGSDKISGYRFHGLHGRVIPVAAGIAVANSELTVVAHGGDGGTLSEGINHLVHAVRNNYKMVFLLHNNSNYGLTTGQASATTRKGVTMNATPDGVVVSPLHVLNFVFSLQPTFVARGFSGDVKQLTGIMEQALQHNGFAFVEILQDCPTYNKATPHDWYLERTYDISKTDGYDPFDMAKAQAAGQDLDEKIATGVLYMAEDSKNFMEVQPNRQGKTSTLVSEVKSGDIGGLLAEFR